MGVVIIPKKKLTIIDTKDKKISDGFKEFYRYCQIKNLSTETLNFYEVSIEKFKSWIGKDLLVKDITKDTIDDYILYLKSTGITDVTVNTNLKGIRVVLYYWMNLGYLESFKIRLIKAVKKIKDTYTKQELEILLKKPNLRECNYVEYRSWVITNTLLGTGIRANTLINLKIKDVDLDNHLLFLSSTKSKKQQIVPMPLSLVNVLEEYIQIRLTQVKDGDEALLFVSAYGQKLNRNSLNHSLRDYNYRRGVLRNGVHIFRHTFAKMSLIDGKIDSLRLQKLLGHADLSMVKEYVEIFTDDLQKDISTYNPLEIMQKENKKGKHLKI